MKIAELNGLNVDDKVCSFVETCDTGTCPMCEKELERLEMEINRKIERGTEVPPLRIDSAALRLSSACGVPVRACCRFPGCGRGGVPRAAGGPAWQRPFSGSPGGCPHSGSPGRSRRWP